MTLTLIMVEVMSNEEEVVVGWFHVLVCFYYEAEEGVDLYPFHSIYFHKLLS